MVPPNGPEAARSGSVWIHWWSSVASAKVFTRSWVISSQELCPRSTGPGPSVRSSGVPETARGTRAQPPARVTPSDARPASSTPVATGKASAPLRAMMLSVGGLPPVETSRRLPSGVLLDPLPALGLQRQRLRHLEPLAVLLAQLLRPRHEAGDAAVVAVDVLDHAAGPGREADAQDRADVRLGDRTQHALVQAAHRIQRLGEEHALLHVLERDPVARLAEVLGQTRPQPRALPVYVFVETGAGRAAAAPEVVDHTVDHRLQAVFHPVRTGRGSAPSPDLLRQG